jgi:hypothetical protein
MRRAALLLAMTPAIAGAQPRARATPDKSLSAADGTLAEGFSVISSVRELSDGRVLVTDERDIRLIAADFRSGRVWPLGRKGDGPQEYRAVARLIPLRGDSTLLPVPLARRWLLLKADKIVATLSSESPALAGIRAGFAVGADDEDHVLAHVMPVTGSAKLPDSLAFIRISRRTGAADTVARSPMPDMSAMGEMSGARPRNNPSGRRQYAVVITSTDQGVMFPDGAIAIVRSQPYRVDWCLRDSPCRQGPVLEAPVKMTDREKQAFLNRAARTASWPPTTDVSATTGWPEYVPPFANPPMRTESTVAFASPDGAVVIERVPTAAHPRQRYDIVGRSGERSATLTVAANERVVGFGRRSVYVAVTDDDGVQRLRRHPWP